MRALTEYRHGKERYDSLPLTIKTVNLDYLRFILILNLHLETGKFVDKQALQNLQDALKNEMRPFLKIWNIPDISIKVVSPVDAKQILNIPIE